jgi:hypothetical protein
LDIMALGLLSRRESRMDLWPRLILNATTTLYYTNLHSSNAVRLNMLVFDRTSLLSILAFLQPSPHIQPFFDNVAYVV